MSNFLAPFFQLFMGKNLFFGIFFYIVASVLNSCLIKSLKKIEKNFGRIFLGLKTVFLRASCFGYRGKGHSPLLLHLVSLLWALNFKTLGTLLLRRRTATGFSASFEYFSQLLFSKQQQQNWPSHSASQLVVVP